MSGLTQALATRFARLALGHVTQEYPNKLDHVLAAAEDARSPRDLHPIFYGSFDWHSCVHGYWLLARVRGRVEAAEARAITALFDAHLTPETVAGELAYLARPASAVFERPYGWAWLLKLQAQLSADRTAEAVRWAAALRPLAAGFADRFKAFLPRADYPIRSGAHGNTAFALRLAADYAETEDPTLLDLARSTAVRWYGDDAGYGGWEPSGYDFLSPALVEAVCMRRLAPEFPGWFDRFLPQLAEGRPAALFTPAQVSDRSDGKIAHLDGLNLSRAWCWQEIAAGVGATHAAHSMMLEAARRHLDAALPHVAGDYAGEHWLATFALLALDEA